MPNYIHYSVIPSLPERLEPLREIASNLWFSWEPDAAALFKEIEPDAWETWHHNPVKLLQIVRQARLCEIAEDEGFLRRLDSVLRRFRKYIDSKETWFTKNFAQQLPGSIAYFSAEFGFHESIPEYSGGLGILAGDHCKAASDLGLPFIAIGLLYRHGYFKQQLTRDGWQEALAMDVAFNELPIQEVRRPDGSPLTISVNILGRNVLAKLWEIKVGRVSAFMMDTDLNENSPEDRLITAELYGGDLEMRIRQEIVLGIGGVRALRAMGMSPVVYHMNEGHAAFLGVERIRQYMADHKIDFYPALQAVASSNVFTTHTPVPAGNDAFLPELMHRYFDAYVRDLRINFDEFMKFGRGWHHQPSDPFSMTILALRMARRANGVSALHGEVSRKMWTTVWPGAPIQEIPISSVTNGIHLHTWLAPEMRALYEKYFGKGWQMRISDPDLWRRVSDIPDEELWQTHLHRKKRLIDFVRRRVHEQRLRFGEAPDRIRAAGHLLDPEVLTIGFARRFATYKRALLICKDLQRLKSLVNNPDRPVQIIFSGKSHPRDDGGKRLIQRLHQIVNQTEFDGKIVFVEDYDANVARHLVQGVDVWMNNPLRPLEASGTSGQKVPPNGGINLSVLDGWWCEGFNGKNGWAIGPDLKEGSPEMQDEVDSSSLYSLLEQTIIPLYYTKLGGRIPLAWVNLMRESIRSVSPVYNSWRMVQEYAEFFYGPSAQSSRRLIENNFAQATELANWKEAMRKSWGQAAVLEVICDNPQRYKILVGDKIKVRAKVSLGNIRPENVLVEAYYGTAHDGDLTDPFTIRLEIQKEEGNGIYWYGGSIETRESGTYGFNVRLLPTHPNLIQKHETRLVTWGKA